MNDKGFTLIELLAVILILGIIALIAIPTVTSIINQSKKSAFETSANNIVKSIEENCQEQLLKDQVVTSSYTFTNGVASPTLNIKGTLPKSGTATVDVSCNVTLSATNGSYTVTKSSTDDKVTVTSGSVIVPIYNVYANGTAVYFNPVTGIKCTAGEAVSTTGTKTGCMKWYAFNDEGNTVNSINLILDHNTTTLLAWNSTNSNLFGPTNIMTQLKTDTAGWTGVTTRIDIYAVTNATANYAINYSTYKARLITANEVAKITGVTTFDESSALASAWFYLDSKTQTQTATTLGSSNYKWLFDYTNTCSGYGCSVVDASTYGYWTATAVSSSPTFAWYVGRDGYLYYNLPINNTAILGIRPVITIAKTVIQ